jgi:hypothetical protein
METLYDPKCTELARYFLEDQSENEDKAAVNELAGLIQEVIEDFMLGRKT